MMLMLIRFHGHPTIRTEEPPESMSACLPPACPIRPRIRTEPVCLAETVVVELSSAPERGPSVLVDTRAPHPCPSRNVQLRPRHGPCLERGSRSHASFGAVCSIAQETI